MEALESRDEINYIKEDKKEKQVVSDQQEAGRQKSHFFRLLLSMLKIGIIGFGGGSALIPVIEDEVVDNQKLISKRDYDEDVISACVTPGALPVEIAAGAGRRSFGIVGMLSTTTVIALPGALFTVILLSALTGNSVISTWLPMISIGIGGFICALLIHYAMETVKNAGKEGIAHLIKNVLIMAAVLLITAESNIYALFQIDAEPVFGLSTLSVLCLAFFVIINLGDGQSGGRLTQTAIFSILYFWCVSKRALFRNSHIRMIIYTLMIVLAGYHLIQDIKSEKQTVKKEGAVGSLMRENIAWLLYIIILALPALIISRSTILYLLKGFLSSLMSFGGGDAYLSVADGMFVQSGMTDTQAFYGTLVPIANALPGSILCKILTGVGFLYGQGLTQRAAGGYAVALAGFGVSVAASGVIFGIVCWLFRTFEDISALKQIGRWIRPIISGILLNVCLTMMRTGMDTGVNLGMNGSIALWLTVIITAVDLFLLTRKKKNNLVIILISAVAGVGAALFFV